MIVNFIHGFTQTGASWGPVIDSMGSAETFCPDAPGHGASPAVDDDMWAAAGAVADRLTPGLLVGYSMGGRLALHIALSRPSLVTGLVLISATPGIRDPAERAARRGSDDALSEHILDVGVDTFIQEWLQGPLWATYSATEADVRARCANTAAGLSSSLRHQGTGAQDDLWPRLGELRMPVLVVSGALDTKFTDIAVQVGEAIGDSQLLTVAGAGHAVHLEMPDVVARAITGFLRGIGPVNG